MKWFLTRLVLSTCFVAFTIVGHAAAGSADTTVVLNPHAKIVQHIGDTFEIEVALDSGVVDATFYSADIAWTNTGTVQLIDAWPDEEWYGMGNCPVDTCFGYDLTTVDDSITVCRVWSILWESNDCDIAVNGYHRVATLLFQSLGGGVVELGYVDDSTIVKGCVDPDSNIVAGTENAVVYVCPLPPEYTYGGDINGSGTGPDISDLVYLVSYMFGGGPEPAFKAGDDYFPQADVNCDGTGPDISDLVYLVNYMFNNGPAPCTLCPQQE
ncbi:MAG TPA: hypothetical protein PLF13_04200 [candidate division Zixibacteria bacterium]|nr:hypothetical protein [candidate division Zixibacteria bacterium]